MGFRTGLSGAAGALILMSSPAWAQLPALQDRPMSPAERTRLASLEGQFTRISAQRNTSVAALRTIARAMGTRLTTQDPDQILKVVDERAQELAKSRERIAVLERELEAVDSMKLAMAVGPMLNAARTAIDEGRLDDAEKALEQAGDRFAQARTGLQGRVDQLAGQEAQIYAQRAGVRSSVSDFAAAAELYGKAADLTPASDVQGRWRFRIAQAQALQDRGDTFGLPDVTAQAIGVLETQALPLAPKAERPADWATTQFRIGVGQGVLGFARNDVPLLKTSVDSIRQAAEATSRETAMDDWVQRRVKLGTSLAMLSDRSDSAPAIEESLATFRSTLAAQPDVGADFYRAYGSALGRMGIFMERAGKPAEAIQAFKDSADAFRAGIAKVDAAASPRLAGDLYNNLSFALKLSAARLHDPAYIRQSIEAARKGLTVVDRSRLPVVWVTLQRRLGWGLVELSMLDPKADPKGLEEGVVALRVASEAVSRANSPTLWAAIQQDLGQGLQLQGERATDAAALDPAIAAFRASNEVLSPTSAPSAWASNQLTVAELLLKQAERSPAADRAGRYAAAEAAFAEAEPVAGRLNEPELTARLADVRRRLNAAMGRP